MANSENSDPKQEVEDSLLYSARHGELKIVKALLEAHKEGKLTLDINCKGDKCFYTLSLTLCCKK